MVSPAGVGCVGRRPGLVAGAKLSETAARHGGAKVRSISAHLRIGDATVRKDLVVAARSRRAPRARRTSGLPPRLAYRPVPSVERGRSTASLSRVGGPLPWAAILPPAEICCRSARLCHGVALRRQGHGRPSRGHLAGRAAGST
eukprot:15435155-Alexandrium_andersonii.AAC.1